MLRNVLFALLLLPVLAEAEPASAEKERPKVGVILPLTGEAASYGEQFRKGLLLNPQSKSFELIFEDSKFDSKTALTAFSKLVNADHVAYLISFGGATCEVLNAQAKEQGLLHLAAGCNTAKFEDPGSTNFRLDVNERIAAAQTARYLKKLGVKKAALLYVNNSWGGAIIKDTKAAFFEEGISVVADVPFDSPQAGDLRTSLIKMKAASPDVIFFISLPNLTPLVLNQFAQNQIKTPIMSNISIENPEVLRLAGADAEGIFYLSVKPNPKSRTEYTDFYSAFPDGNPFAAWAYDSASLLAIARDGNPPQAVLQNLRTFLGAFNVYSFDSQGELELPYEIREIKDGKYAWRADLS